MIKVVNNCDTEGHLFPADWCGQELIHEEDLIKAYEYHNKTNNIVMAVVWKDRSGTGDVREWYERIPLSKRYSMFETLHDVSRYVPSDVNFYKEDLERRDAEKMVEMEAELKEVFG